MCPKQSYFLLHCILDFLPDWIYKFCAFSNMAHFLTDTYVRQSVHWIIQEFSNISKSRGDLLLESHGLRVMLSWEIRNDDFKESICYIHMDDWDTLVLLCCSYSFFLFSLNKRKSKTLLSWLGLIWYWPEHERKNRRGYWWELWITFPTRPISQKSLCVNAPVGLYRITIWWN